jgi:hypothetical protein
LVPEKVIPDSKENRLQNITNGIIEIRSHQKKPAALPKNGQPNRTFAKSDE